MIPVAQQKKPQIEPIQPPTSASSDTAAHPFLLKVVRSDKAKQSSQHAQWTDSDGDNGAESSSGDEAMEQPSLIRFKKKMQFSKRSFNGEPRSFAPPV